MQHGQLCRLRPRAIRNSFVRSYQMEILQRVKMLGKTHMTGQAADRQEAPRPRKANPLRALRNWRVIMDKVHIIMSLAALQRSVGEWCLFSAHSEVSTEPTSKETMQDVYAELIRGGAKVLKPLKSKEAPTMAASNCVHPKKHLKGGGNSQSSYIVCMACHSRWENEHRSSAIRKELKAAVRPGGLLSHGSMGEEMAMSPPISAPAPSAALGEVTIPELFEARRREMQTQTKVMAQQMEEAVGQAATSSMEAQQVRKEMQVAMQRMTTEATEREQRQQRSLELMA